MVRLAKLNCYLRAEIPSEEEKCCKRFRRSSRRSVSVEVMLKRLRRCCLQNLEPQEKQLGSTVVYSSKSYKKCQIMSALLILAII